MKMPLAVVACGLSNEQTDMPKLLSALLKLLVARASEININSALMIPSRNTPGCYTTNCINTKACSWNYWVERKVLAFSKRWPFFEALSYT
jgi:hypothetical protein